MSFIIHAEYADCKVLDRRSFCPYAVKPNYLSTSLTNAQLSAFGKRGEQNVCLNLTNM